MASQGVSRLTTPSWARAPLTSTDIPDRLVDQWLRITNNETAGSGATDLTH